MIDTLSHERRKTSILCASNAARPLVAHQHDTVRHHDWHLRAVIHHNHNSARGARHNIVKSARQRLRPIMRSHSNANASTTAPDYRSVLNTIDGNVHRNLRGVESKLGRAPD